MSRVLVLLVLILSVSHTLQKGKRVRRQKQNNISSSVVIPYFRSFLGFIVPPTKPVLNGTRPPLTDHAAPALRLYSNHTVSYLQGPLSTRVIPGVYILTVVVGVPANVVILGSLLAKIRKVSSAILYCSLALSDLLLLLSLTFKAHYHLHGNHWTLGETACRLVTTCFYGNLYCSSLTLACISIKRYLAVVHPFRYKSLPKRACTALVCAAVWAASGAAVVPELVVQQSFWIPQLNRTTCHDVLPLYSPSHSFLLYYHLVLTMLGLLVPLVVTVACYAQVIHELSHSHFDWAMYIKASSLVLGIFLVCFLPAGVLHLLHYVQLSAYRGEELYVHFNVAVCLCCLHACLDPFLFLIMSKSVASRPYIKTHCMKSGICVSVRHCKLMFTPSQLKVSDQLQILPGTSRNSQYKVRKSTPSSF